MFVFECNECGDSLDSHTMRSYCSYECYKTARERWVRVHNKHDLDAPPFPQIGHYPDAPGVGKWTPSEMENRINELVELAHSHA